MIFKKHFSKIYGTRKLISQTIVRKRQSVWNRFKTRHGTHNLSLSHTYFMWYKLKKIHLYSILYGPLHSQPVYERAGKQNRFGNRFDLSRLLSCSPINLCLVCLIASDHRQLCIETAGKTHEMMKRKSKKNGSDHLVVVVFDKSRTQDNFKYLREMSVHFEVKWK